MKTDPAGQYHARELLERLISLNRYAAFCCSKCDELVVVVGVVLQHPQTLHDELSQEFVFLLFSYWTVNSGGEDHRDVCRRDACLNQASNQKVYYVSTRGGASCIRHNDQHCIVAAGNLIEWW